jgi:predicted ATPase
MFVKSALLNKIRYKLIGDDYDKKSNLFTVIIGVNGTGKSRLLNRIVTAVKGINNEKKGQEIPSRISRQLDVVHGGLSYSIYGRAGTKKSYIGDSERKAKIVPGKFKIIGVTTSPFDKFPVDYKLRSKFKHHDDDVYHYIGLRISENSYNKSNFLNLFARSLLKNGFMDSYGDVFDLLRYKKTVKIEFKSKIPSWEIMKISRKIDSKISIQKNDFLALFSKYCPSIEGNIQDDTALIKKAFIALVKYKYLINDTVMADQGFDGLPYMLLLLDIGLIQVKTIELIKVDGKVVNISEASSGEQCILLTLLNISGVIRNDAVICIDEPEISLHPEWQKKFMPLLKKCFENYKRCHFIISTHSPLVISELGVGNSFILDMNKNNAVSSGEYFKKSMDFQLVELFGIPGSNNEYLNRMAVKTLSRLSSMCPLTKDEELVAEKLIEISSKLEDDDPVKELIGIIDIAIARTK